MSTNFPQKPCGEPPKKSRSCYCHKEGNNSMLKSMYLNLSQYFCLPYKMFHLNAVTEDL